MCNKFKHCQPDFRRSANLARCHILKGTSAQICTKIQCRNGGFVLLHKAYVGSDCAPVDYCCLLPSFPPPGPPPAPLVSDVTETHAKGGGCLRREEHSSNRSAQLKCLFEHLLRAYFQDQFSDAQTMQEPIGWTNLQICSHAILSLFMETTNNRFQTWASGFVLKTKSQWGLILDWTGVKSGD